MLQKYGWKIFGIVGLVLVFCFLLFRYSLLEQKYENQKLYAKQLQIANKNQANNIKVLEEHYKKQEKALQALDKERTILQKEIAKKQHALAMLKDTESDYWKKQKIPQTILKLLQNNS